MGAEKKSVLESPDPVPEGGADGGFEHPPTPEPKAPVELQGVPGEFAQRGSATPRTRVHTAIAVLVRTDPLLTRKKNISFCRRDVIEISTPRVFPGKKLVHRTMFVAHWTKSVFLKLS
jgi:hypothetical protein